MQIEHLLISHYHDPVDGYVYLEENDWLSDGQLSASSVIHTPKSFGKKSPKVDHLVRRRTSTPVFIINSFFHTDNRQAPRSQRVCHNQRGGGALYSRYRRFPTAKPRGCWRGVCESEQRLCPICPVS